MTALIGHTDIVSALTTLTHGELVSGAFDKKIRIWDWSSADYIEIIGHADYVILILIY